MIKSIKHLRNFGIFRDYKNTDAKDFNKYNLFYGWNGSGKSTLADLFRCIEKGTNSTEFLSPEFVVSTYSGVSITQNNISESNLNIHTFNSDFIKENIAWDDIIKSILLVGDINIEERQKLIELQEALERDNDLLDKRSAEMVSLDKTITNFETDCARHIKTSLKSIDTSDNYYMNYDKRKLQRVIAKNINVNNLSDFLLGEEERMELTNAAKPDQKPAIQFAPQAKNQKEFVMAKERLSDLLKASIVSKAIKKLADNDDIRSWVETGLNLHARHDRNTCEFCGNAITEERIKQLEEHFNDDYKHLQARLGKANDWLNNQHIEFPQLPVKSDFYDEFQQEYGELLVKLEQIIKLLNEEILLWRAALEKKIKNPLDTNIAVEAIKESSIESYNSTIVAISTVIGKHNQKSENFINETNRAKKQLELHYAATEIDHFRYYEKLEEVEELKLNNKKLNENIAAMKNKISSIENAMSNEGLGAGRFNETLRRFLGRGDLTLHFNKAKKGYEIHRDNSPHISGKLSEGEKTAIAFVYFITKLQESGNKIEDSIIVVDDPISSFDSNHLFHAYSFLKLNCANAKQLFVLTHNLGFFKLVRDWIIREKGGADEGLANFYTVKSNNTRPRASVYRNAESALVQYHSEYHYIFSRLYLLRSQEMLETDDYFLAANLSRKLLEVFLSFKFPQNRGGFRNSFNVAVSFSATSEEKEKIWKFINQYSHHDFIETDDYLVDNMIGEGISVISDIFEWINELDSNHYQEMMKVVKK